MSLLSSITAPCVRANLEVGNCGSGASFAGTGGNNFERARAATAHLIGRKGAARRQRCVLSRGKLNVVAIEFDGPFDAILVLVDFHFHLSASILFTELKLVGRTSAAPTFLDDIGRFCVHWSAQLNHDREEKEG